MGKKDSITWLYINRQAYAYGHSEQHSFKMFNLFYDHGKTSFPGKILELANWDQ